MALSEAGDLRDGAGDPRDALLNSGDSEVDRLQPLLDGVGGYRDRVRIGLGRVWVGDRRCLGLRGAIVGRCHDHDIRRGLRLGRGVPLRGRSARRQYGFG
jgi:hypothetical protein